MPNSISNSHTRTDSMRSTVRTMKAPKIVILSTAFSLMLTTAIPLKETHSGFSLTASETGSVSFDNWIPTVSVTNNMMDGRCFNVYIYPPYGSAATNFSFQYSKNSDMSSATTLTLTGLTTPQTVIKGVSLNTTYYYRARSNNGLGADWSKTASIKTHSDNLYSCM